jgi:hypothetical protein
MYYYMAEALVPLAALALHLLVPLAALALHLLVPLAALALHLLVPLAALALPLLEVPVCPSSGSSKGAKLPPPPARKLPLTRAA